VLMRPESATLQADKQYDCPAEHAAYATYRITIF